MQQRQLNNTSLVREMRFDSRPEQCRRMVELVKRYAPAAGHYRLIEIGCGTGGQLEAFYDELDGAELVGLDISEKNIQAASKRFADRKPAPELVVDDILHTKQPPAEIVFTYSTLYLVPGSAEQVFAPAAGIVAPGGIFINAMPTASVRNHVINLMRRTARALPRTALQSLAGMVAGVLYRNHLSREELQQRLPYLTVVAHHFDGPRTDSILARYGLEKIESVAEPCDSMFKLKHRISIYRMRG